jgi:16S rRNA (guanine966-N2)-methyltransferase
MRITGGHFLNRPLTAPAGNAVRPASDKVRAAVFNILMHRFPASLAATQVLDVFCGAGTYGLEALSRGASFCTFVDHSRPSLAAARANATRLECLEQCRFLQTDARRLAAHSPAPMLAFLDPPYATDLLADTLPRIIDFLAAGGVAVCETPKDTPVIIPATATLAVEKAYGTTKIVILIKG